MGRNKVLVAMSGGVDSSVVAAILVEQGYDVTGIMLKMWSDSNETDNEGLQPFDYDARLVANKLGIPFYTFDVEDIFRNKVIDYFISEYSSGRTPNPCVQCNRHIKFGLLFDKANELGIDYIATGHYALVEYDKYLDRFLLKKSHFVEKDQSYVLYSLKQSQLKRVLFPIGSYKKEYIREIAKRFELPIANKPDSQDICFIQDNDYIRFLEHNVSGISKPGNFVDKAGKILGKHRGIIHYTIGQRRGLEIAFGKRTFVTGINVDDNIVILGDEQDTFSNELVAEDVNFIPFDSLEDSIRVNAKIRYSAKESPATIKPIGDNTVKVVFDNFQRAITPGQSVVFYSNDIVVGGGIIA